MSPRRAVLLGQNYLWLVVTGEVDALARLARSLGIETNVGVELRLLGSNLGAVVLAALGLVNLQAENLEFQLEDLVLDLADLESIGWMEVSRGRSKARVDDVPSSPEAALIAELNFSVSASSAASRMVWMLS